MTRSNCRVAQTVKGTVLFSLMRKLGQSLIACLVASSLLAAANLFAQEPQDPFASGSPAAEKPAKPKKAPVQPMPIRVGAAAIEDALSSTTQFEFTETPLQEVIDTLKERHKIEIQIDSKALTDVGIGSDTSVTVNLKGVSLRSALNLMLKELNLTWTIQDEVLLITTPEEADNELFVKVYDVADLVECRDERNQLSDDYDTLIDIITATVKPTSWDNVGGPGSIQGSTLGTAKVLVILQTYRIHREIADLLENIRKVGKQHPNASAGPPRRSKPASSSQRGKAAAGPGMKGMGMMSGGMGGGMMGGPPGNAPKPAAKTSGANPQVQFDQPPKPDAPKNNGGMGMF